MRVVQVNRCPPLVSRRKAGRWAGSVYFAMKTLDEHSDNKRSEDGRAVERLQNAVSQMRQFSCPNATVIHEAQRLITLAEKSAVQLFATTDAVAWAGARIRRRDEGGGLSPRLRARREGRTPWFTTAAKGNALPKWFGRWAGQRAGARRGRTPRHPAPLLAHSLPDLRAKTLKVRVDPERFRRGFADFSPPKKGPLMDGPPLLLS
jgi:hypothetical protein